MIGDHWSSVCPLGFLLGQCQYCDPAGDLRIVPVWGQANKRREQDVAHIKTSRSR